MTLEFSICEVKWDRYPRVSENAHAREWLKFQATRGLAANTIEAYGRDLDCYLGFLDTRNVPFDSVIRPTIGAYIQSMCSVVNASDGCSPKSKGCWSSGATAIERPESMFLARCAQR